MILTYHHILWDGCSSGILIDSFTRLCNEIEVDKELPSKIKVTPWREYIKLVRNRDIDGEKNTGLIILMALSQMKSLPSLLTINI